MINVSLQRKNKTLPHIDRVNVELDEETNETFILYKCDFKEQRSTININYR